MNPDPYTIIKSTGTLPFIATKRLRDYFIFGGILILLPTLYLIIVSALHLEGSLNSRIDSFQQELHQVGGTVSLSLAGILVVLAAIKFIGAIILTVGLRQRWRVLIGFISIPTALLALTSIIEIGVLLCTTTVRLFELSRVVALQDKGSISMFFNLLKTFGWSTVIPIIIAIMLLVIYLLIELMLSVKSYREVLKKTPSSVRYPNGVLIESPRIEDLYEVAKIFLDSQNVSKQEHKTQTDRWEELVEGERWQSNLRVARLPGAIVGFAFISEDQDFVALYAFPDVQTFKVQEYLLQDMLRLKQKANFPVSKVQIPSTAIALQAILLENDWKLSNTIPYDSTDMIFEFVGKDLTKDAVNS